MRLKRTKQGIDPFTGKPEQTPEEEAYLPVAGYIVKPVGAIELVSKVRKALKVAQK